MHVPFRSAMFNSLANVELMQGSGDSITLKIVGFLDYRCT